MNDRELLAMAAMTAGIPGLKYRGGPCIPAAWIYDYEDARTYKTWNPLTDDGDALRLAVKLHIIVEYRLGPYEFGRTIYAHKKVRGAADIAILQEYAVDPGPVQRLTDYLKTLGTDPNEATRRAIVRAAAEIGATQPGKDGGGEHG
jgi:hypothetical protein